MVTVSSRAAPARCRRSARPAGTRTSAARAPRSSAATARSAAGTWRLNIFGDENILWEKYLRVALMGHEIMWRRYSHSSVITLFLANPFRHQTCKRCLTMFGLKSTLPIVSVWGLLLLSKPVVPSWTYLNVWLKSKKQFYSKIKPLWVFILFVQHRIHVWYRHIHHHEITP